MVQLFFVVALMRCASLSFGHGVELFFFVLFFEWFHKTYAGAKQRKKRSADQTSQSNAEKLQARKKKQNLGRHCS